MGIYPDAREDREKKLKTLKERYLRNKCESETRDILKDLKKCCGIIAEQLTDLSVGLSRLEKIDGLKLKAQRQPFTPLPIGQGVSMHDGEIVHEKFPDLRKVKRIKPKRRGDTNIARR